MSKKPPATRKTIKNKPSQANKLANNSIGQSTTEDSSKQPPFLSDIRTDLSRVDVLEGNPLASWQGKKWQEHCDFKTFLSSLKRHYEIIATADSSPRLIKDLKGFKYKGAVLTLYKSDMHDYCLAPKAETFIVSVCKSCKMILKPHALVRHIEAKHRYRLRGDLVGIKSYCEDTGRRYASKSRTPEALSDPTYRLPRWRLRTSQRSIRDISEEQRPYHQPYYLRRRQWRQYQY